MYQANNNAQQLAQVQDWINHTDQRLQWTRYRSQQ